MKTKFKISDSTYNRALDLYSKLHEHGVEVWMKLNTDDMSDCHWRFVDNQPPSDSRQHNGGVGALINDLRQACVHHGIIKPVVRIINRNHMRLSCDANGKQWTTDNGG